ncbi:glycosyltransferase family 39 protein [Candidatus Poribacteria bacterium]|nr:glycosyltransferase family 39 protein [Candidatus Poribacteria bacterium]
MAQTALESAESKSSGLIFTSAAVVCFLAIAAATSYNLTTKSLWYDETISSYYARQSFLTIARMSLLDHVPPLYYWLLKVYSGILGRSDAALRSLSVLCNLAAAVYLWRLARERLDEKTALYALVFFATSNYLLIRAQTARAYPLFLFFTMASVYYFFRSWQEEKKRWWLLYSFCLTCSLYTLYLGVATVAALSVTVLLSAAKRLSRWHLRYVLWTGVSLAGFLPWAILLTVTHPSRNPDWWGDALPSGNFLKDFLSLFSSFFEAESLRQMPGNPAGAILAKLLLIGVGSILIHSLIGWRKNERATRVLVFGCLFILISVLCNFVLNVFAAVDFPTSLRFISLIPIAYLIVAAGISKLRLKGLEVLVLLVLVFPNLIAMRGTYASSSIEDWREMAQYIETNWQPGDCIVFVPGYMNIAFDHYAGNRYPELGYPKGLMNPARMYWGYHSMRDSSEAERFLLENAVIIRRSHRIWLIHSHNILFDTGRQVPDATMLIALQNKPLLKQEDFRRYSGILLYLFSRADASAPR